MGASHLVKTKRMMTDERATEDLFANRESVFREGLFLYNSSQNKAFTAGGSERVTFVAKLLLALSLVSVYVRLVRTLLEVFLHLGLGRTDAMEYDPKEEVC